MTESGQLNYEHLHPTTTSEALRVRARVAEEAVYNTSLALLKRAHGGRFLAKEVEEMVARQANADTRNATQPVGAQLDSTEFAELRYPDRDQTAAQSLEESPVAIDPLADTVEVVPATQAHSQAYIQAEQARRNIDAALRSAEADQRQTVQNPTPPAQAAPLADRLREISLDNGGPS